LPPTAWRKAGSSNAFIDDRSIGSMPASSDRIDGRVGPLKPNATPTVERTIGMPKALAVLANSRTCNSTRSALVSDRDFEHLVLVVDQHQGALLGGPDTQIFHHHLSPCLMLRQLLG